MKSLWLLPILIAVAALVSFRSAPAKQPVAERMVSVQIPDVPHIRQKPDFCGEACVAMYLQRLGRQVDQDYVFDQSRLDPLLGRGCYTRELAAAIKHIGFVIGPVWFKVKAAEASGDLDRQFAVMHADLVRGIPSLVCMHYHDAPGTTEHFRLVLGYDSKTDEVLYHEPAIDGGAYQRLPRQTFLKLWPLKYEADHWTVVRMPLKPGRISNARAADKPTDADYSQHIRQLKPNLPSADFTYLVQKPFVVIGDESSERVQQRAVQTVKWAVDRLKNDYFRDDPDEIINIWLFKDKTSYDKHVDQLFGESPTTPYGYYSPVHRALIMNIRTGGGTLVHEIVHPFMAANFPDCPAWFNEGLASLYEQSRDVGGHIHGSTNWRLRGLQIAITADDVPAFATLCNTTTREFYNEDPGTNYAQARYLCYYLQEHGKLVKYYHQFRANSARDPGGYKTLTSVLGEEDMEAFKDKWEEFVLQLRF